MSASITYTAPPASASALVLPSSVAELLELEQLLENVRAARELFDHPDVQAALTDIERDLLRHIF